MGGRRGEGEVGVLSAISDLCSRKSSCPLFKHLSAGLRNSQDTVHFLKVKLLRAIARGDPRFIGFLKHWKVLIGFLTRMLSLSEGSKLVISLTNGRGGLTSYRICDFNLYKASAFHIVVDKHLPYYPLPFTCILFLNYSPLLFK